MKNIIIFIVFFSFELIANELPELGSSFDTLISASDEKKIKFQIMNQVYSSNSVIRDSEINDYLDNVGNDLIRKGLQDTRDINFFIINDASINAFAMLGNIIGVHSGLIFAANSESELASVLSHEIAHISQKHLLRLFDSQAKNTYKSYLSMALAIILARSNPQLASAAITAGSASQAQNTLDYTRDNEREADRIGLKILNDSGYDPRGFIDFFATLQKFNNFATGASPAFLRTHPITSERISEIQDRLNNYNYIQVKNRIEFFLIKSKLQALIADYSSVDEIFKNNIEMQRFLNKPATYFGLVYALLRQNKIQEARKYFDELNKMEINSPMIIELNANLLIKEKKLEKAFEIYKKGINENPRYRTFIYGISKLLLQANQPLKVIELLNNYKDFFKTDPDYYDLLAKAHNMAGNSLLEHESLSNYFYYQFNIQDAITQMDMAVRSNSDHFYDQSRVEYQLKELKRENELMIN